MTLSDHQIAAPIQKLLAKLATQGDHKFATGRRFKFWLPPLFSCRLSRDTLWDTGSSQGRLLSTMLAAIAEFERELIRERTGEGRKRAMANGVKFGRKRKLSEYQRAEAVRRRAAGETLASIAKSYAVDISMISRLQA